MKSALSSRDLVDTGGNASDFNSFIRTCNLGPGGGVIVGDEDGGGYIQVGVENYYKGEHPDLVNLQNRFQVLDFDGNDIVDVPITREECYDLAEFFLSVAQREGNW